MQLLVESNWERMSVRIYLKETVGRDVIIIGHKDGKLVEHIMQRVPTATTEVAPLLEMNSNMFDIFLKAVADYSSNNGLKTENENLLKGKLQATEKHLEDLRKNFDKVLDKIVK